MTLSELGFCWMLGFGAFAVFLIAHILAFRLLVPKYRFRVLKRIYFVVGLLLLIFGYLLLSVTDIVQFVPNSTLEVALSAVGFLWFLYMGYLEVFFLIDRSVSLRVNVELHRRPTYPFSLAEIQEIYGTQGAFEGRIDVMERNDYLVRSGNRVSLTAKGRRIGKGALILKRFLKLGIGG